MPDDRLTLEECATLEKLLKRLPMSYFESAAIEPFRAALGRYKMPLLDGVLEQKQDPAAKHICNALELVDTMLKDSGKRTGFNLEKVQGQLLAALTQLDKGIA